MIADDPDLPDWDELAKFTRNLGPFGEARSLTSIAIDPGGSSGIGLAEACLRRLYRSPELEGAIAILTGYGPRIAEELWGQNDELFTEFPKTFERRMADCEFTPHHELIQAVADGLLTVTGFYSELGPIPVPLDYDTLCKGRLYILSESLTCFRSRHKKRYWSLRLVPTRKGLASRATPPTKIDRVAAFTAAIEFLGFNIEGKTRVISATKRAVYDYLCQQNKAHFGTFHTFSHAYSSGGVWAKHLPFPITWGSDKSVRRELPNVT